MAKADDGRIGTLMHAADLHLGAPFKGLSKDLDDPDLFKQLKERAKKAFDNLVKATIEKKADILVLAGDIYDGTDHVYEIQFQFQKGLKRLEEENIKVFLVHGNHDPFAELQTLLELPDNVHVFESGKPQLEEVVLKSGKKIEVAGVSFNRRSEKENLAKLFHDLEPVNKNLTVGILHTSIGGNKDHDDYAPCSVQDLEDAPIGYWALGHIHKREVHEMRKGAYRAYSGNLQGRSTKESECVSKGALEVAIYEHGFGKPEFFACDDNTVRFNRVSVDVTGDELQQDVYKRVEAEVKKYREEINEDCLVVSHVEIKGRTKAHEDLTKSKENGTIVEEIRKHCRGGDKNDIVLKVKLSTTPQVDDEELLQGDGFAATLFKDLKAFKEENSLDDVEGMLDDLQISREIVIKNFEEVLDRVEQILLSEWANRNE